MAASLPLHAGQEKLGVYHLVYSTGVYKLFPFLLIYSIGFATLWPQIPTLVTNGFASQAAGYHVECELYPPASSPVECRNAHSQAVIWNSWTSFVSGSILSFLCAPFVGKLSDHWGRKPFMLAGITLALAPIVTLLLFIWGLVKIEWYYPMTALNGMVSSFSMSLTSVADVLHQTHRATAIGYLSACFSIGILVGPVLGGYISTQTAVYVCIAMIGATFLYVLVFVPETAPRVLARRRLQAGEDTDEEEQLAQPLILDEESTPGHGSTPAEQKANEDVPRRSSLLGAHDTVTAVTTLGAMDFDPIPNVVPHAHVHTLLVAPCDDSTSSSADIACSSVDSPSGGEDAKPWLHKPLGLSIDPSAAPAGGARPSGSGGASSKKACRTPVLRRTWSDMLVGWRVIRGSSYYRKLVVIWVIVAMTLEGAQDLLMQYLQLQLGFNTEDQAHVLITLAACGLVIKVFALAELVRLLGEQKLLMLGLTAYMFENIFLALAPTKACALLAIGAGSLSCVNWPASVALQTRHADPCDIGAVQGALSGISSLASGLGPIGFAMVFAAFSRTDSSLPYFPQIVWYIAAVLSLMAILLTATLHLNEPDAKKPSAAEGQYQAPHEAHMGQTRSAGGGGVPVSQPAPATV